MSNKASIVKVPDVGGLLTSFSVATLFSLGDYSEFSGRPAERMPVITAESYIYVQQDGKELSIGLSVQYGIV